MKLCHMKNEWMDGLVVSGLETGTEGGFASSPVVVDGSVVVFLQFTRLQLSEVPEVAWHS